MVHYSWQDRQDLLWQVLCIQGPQGKPCFSLDREIRLYMFIEEAEDGGKFWEISWDKEKAMSSYRIRT